MSEAQADCEGAARFRPLRLASRGQRRLGYLIGSAAWLVALVVLAVAVDRADVVGLALAVVAVSLVAGTVVSTLLRRGRLREERSSL